MTAIISKHIVFVDTETDVGGKKLHDIGALGSAGQTFHSSSISALAAFIQSAEYICGHNIVHHDAHYISTALPPTAKLVDTLYLSPLLFPHHPYHKLLKDDKLQTDEMNNPVNDCHKAQDLFYDELNAYYKLSDSDKQILGKLLRGFAEFSGFFQLVGFAPDGVSVVEQISHQYDGLICGHADLRMMVSQYPCELAYALALVRTGDRNSITPPWVLLHYPQVENIILQLRHTPCAEGCSYCNRRFDPHTNLKAFFGYDDFRTYDGEPLQEKAVRAAIAGKSLLAVFPTGGGKSLTFQLPALIEGETVHGLTVVISPLQSLMKDQVDNLAAQGINSAVTINGLLDPISRSEAIQRVSDGSASILYISPEMLRSKTIEHLLDKRNVVRFVIDEAHCFSAWGQDFRVDYLYIGEFISKMQLRKQRTKPIPISCFTATAKQKVISDICDYFQRHLGVELQMFASSASRENLHYSVIHVDSDEDKYSRLRELIRISEGPSIVYVSRTRMTRDLALRLTRDGLRALPFNGKMDPNEKVENQNAFMSGLVRTIVATSAFGMGVDKKDVSLVVHYDISDSLENYVQEAGRAGRDPNMQARCYVLFGDQDLDKHFVLLNQTKLSISEIQQVWRAIKKMTGMHKKVCCSALEIARQAGWDDSVSDVETRVRTAVSALEQAGYVERGHNVPHVFATGITVRNMDEAHVRINQSSLFEEKDRENAVRIIKSLISSKNTSSSADGEAESRIDYLADILGMTKEVVISAVERMRQEGILADSRDISVHLMGDDTLKKSQGILERFAKLEKYILSFIPLDGWQLTMKQLNDQAVSSGVANSTEKNLRTIVNFLETKGYLRKKKHGDVLSISPAQPSDILAAKFQRRVEVARFVLERLYGIWQARDASIPQGMPVLFSEVEMLRQYQAFQASGLFGMHDSLQLSEIEEALLYLSKIGAVRLDGGFLVLYNAMEIFRLKDMRSSYKQDDYRLLNEFYKQKIQQIHIVGEYANLMVRNYQAALEYVQDYFQMDHKHFVAKYFKGTRATDLEKNITPAKYDQLFGKLSARQREIITDKDSRYIVVAAGPGSGKTKVLVHKMASLLMLEEVKHEQLLMLTFSRAAATEFKKRLLGLIGNAAHFVEIKTFHAYCFDLLGRIGNLDDAKGVVARAAQMISQGEVEPSRINKTVLLLDEAQDMDCHEYALVQALMKANEEMRVIAVGDDDQNVFQFRGADSRYMRDLVVTYSAKFYEMTDNYRSCQNVVELANNLAATIHGRMKKTPISAVQHVAGKVEVVEHISPNMELPLVEHVKRTHGSASACVLTNTNDEANRITALLRRNGIACRLIQSMDTSRFVDLAEVRYFFKQIEKELSSPIVSEELWYKAKAALESCYSTSACLELLSEALADFKKVNRTIYWNDLNEFFRESSIEDFCRLRKGEIMVSTIHKAKGLEFDTVYLYVSDARGWDDDRRRQLYVGLTRAKNNLFIHCCGKGFGQMGVENYHVDNNPYPEPKEISLMLTHKDVILDFFKDKKRTILSLRSGEPLSYDSYMLFDKQGNPVCRMSEKQRRELEKWAEKGYRVSGGYVRYIVAWRQADWPEHEPNAAVLLPELKLCLAD